MIRAVAIAGLLALAPPALAQQAEISKGLATGVLQLQQMGVSQGVATIVLQQCAMVDKGIATFVLKSAALLSPIRTAHAQLWPYPTGTAGAGGPDTATCSPL